MFQSALVYYYVVVPAAESAKRSISRAVEPVISGTTEFVSRVTTPVLTTAYAAGSTVVSWVEPLPSLVGTTKWKYGGDLDKWKHQALNFITENNSLELFKLFKDPAQRNQLQDPHVLGALHHPGLALDLFVVHDKKSTHDYWLKNHYADWSGTGRARLFSNICHMISEDITYYEPLIRKMLNDQNSLLFEVLHDHRYSLSVPALGGSVPKTLAEVNSLLEQLEQDRKLSGVPSLLSSKRNL